MWKTNKWVSEWVIRQAIAHLQPGPLPPAGLPVRGARESEWRVLRIRGYR